MPEEYVLTMRRTMLNACPASSYGEVARIITEELGSPPEALFAEFDAVPIASASLAQVLGPVTTLFTSVLHGYNFVHDRDLMTVAGACNRLVPLRRCTGPGRMMAGSWLSRCVCTRRPQRLSFHSPKGGAVSEISRYQGRWTSRFFHLSLQQLAISMFHLSTFCRRLCNSMYYQNPALHVLSQATVMKRWACVAGACRCSMRACRRAARRTR